MTDQLLVGDELSIEEKVHLSWTALFGGFDRDSNTRTEGLVQWQKRQMEIAQHVSRVLGRIAWLLGGVFLIGIGNAVVLWAAHLIDYLSHIAHAAQTLH